MGTDVLIVGAGPAGLMLANQLVRRGVRVEIIDRQPGPSRLAVKNTCLPIALRGSTPSAASAVNFSVRKQMKAVLEHVTSTGRAACCPSCRKIGARRNIFDLRQGHPGPTGFFAAFRLRVIVRAGARNAGAGKGRVENDVECIALNAIRSYNPCQRQSHGQRRLHRRGLIVSWAALKRQEITAGIAPSIDAHDSAVVVSNVLMAGVQESADVIVRCHFYRPHPVCSQ